jgi:hypothetical protein
MSPPYKASPTQERKPTPVNSDDDDPNMSFDQQRHLKRAKNVATKEAAKSPPESEHPMATQSKGKGQESPKETVPARPIPKRKASRAGGLQSAVGSGSTDTCVPPGHLSQT